MCIIPVWRVVILMRFQRKYSDEIINSIIETYLSGLSIEDTAKKLQIPFGTVYRFLTLKGVNRKRHIADINHDFFQKIDSEEKAYWLGFITADGCIQYNRKVCQYSILLTLAEIDLTHLEKWQSCLKATTKIRKYVCKKGYKPGSISYSSSINSRKLVEDIMNQGVLPAKTGYCSPAIINPNLQKHYWRGIIDGDGHLSIGKRKKKGILHPQPVLGLTGDKDICYGFREFCKQFIPTNAKVFARKNTKNCYGFKLTDSYAWKILNILYGESTIFLDRKKEKYLEIRDFCLTRSAGGYSS